MIRLNLFISYRWGSRTVMYHAPLVISAIEVGDNNSQLAAPLTFSVKPAISYI